MKYFIRICSHFIECKKSDFPDYNEVEIYNEDLTVKGIWLY